MTAERDFLAFLLGVVVGVVVWLFSQSLTGRAEPWDGNVLAYLSLLFGAGLLASLAIRPHWWMPYLGVLAGQVGYGVAPVIACLFGGSCSETANLLPIGAVALLFYSLPTLFGSVLVHVARR